jgi:hypothetical protein
MDLRRLRLIGIPKGRDTSLIKVVHVIVVDAILSFSTFY